LAIQAAAEVRQQQMERRLSAGKMQPVAVPPAVFEVGSVVRHSKWGYRGVSG